MWASCHVLCARSWAVDSSLPDKPDPGWTLDELLDWIVARKKIGVRVC